MRRRELRLGMDVCCRGSVVDVRCGGCGVRRRGRRLGMDVCCRGCVVGCGGCGARRRGWRLGIGIQKNAVSDTPCIGDADGFPSSGESEGAIST